MADTAADLAKIYFPGTGRSYDRVVRWTTLGLDARWKRRMLDRLPPCERILELACGTGILTGMLLERNPGAALLGVDLTEDYLGVARGRFAGRPGVEFRQGDATAVPVADRGPFDAVVTCYLPKYVDLHALVGHVTPAVRPGGVALLHDFTRPRGFVPRLLWRAWFGVLNLVAPLLHPEWRQVFDKSLTRLLSTSKWVRGARLAFEAHGWIDVSIERYTWGAATVVRARRPGAAGG